MFEFSGREIRDLIIALIVLSFCFAISSVGLEAHGIVSIFPIVLVGVGIGFILRELGQKFAAVRCGCEAEFRLWPIGLLIAFVTAFIGIVFAFPGEIRTNPSNVSEEVAGKIGIAGPIANMVLALLFIAIAALIFPFTLHSDLLHLIYLILTVGFSVNSFLATFNLFPIYTLDGIKVFKWNAKIWIVVFAIAAVMMLFSITIGAENMVSLIIDS